MEVEKRSSKGGFLNLFDWNGKSRRKLFSDNCDRQEEVKKGKGNDEASTIRTLQMNFVEKHASSSHSGGSDMWNSSSMAINDEVQGSKAPGVVARLMGLDSLPPSGEPKIHKVQNQKIDRFQNEILPPKSVKPIVMTHNKLLSPIKSPRFVPPKNATQIMEAASRIMEAGPEAVHRGRAGSNSSASVPLRIRELKLRLESENESSRLQQFKKQNINGGQNVGRRTTRSSLVSEQRKEERNRNSSKDSGKEKQSSSNRHQVSSQRTKIPSNRMNNALRQNTQKQNSSSGRSDSVSKSSSTSSKQDRQMQLRSDSVSKTVNKVAVRAETSNRTVRTNTVRDAASLRNKKHGLRNGESVTSDKILSRNDKMSARYEFGTGQSMDVVSFTFSSPLKRCSMEEKFSCNRMIRDDEFSGVNGDSSLSMLLEQKLRELKNKVELYNSDLTRTDSLFTSPSSLKDEDSFSTSTCSVQDSVSIANLINTSWNREESSQLGGDVDEEEMSSLTSDFDCSSVASVRQKCQAQLLDIVEEFSYGSSRNEPDFVPATAFPVLRAFVGGSRDDTNGKDNARIHVPESFDFSVPTSFSRTITNWELEYVKNILNKADLTLNPHFSDQEVVNPSLFDELESQQNPIIDNDDFSKLQRKVLFDRTNEWLDEKYRDLMIGNPKSWMKWEALLQKNSWVSDEVYREINGQICIGDMMVDVIVNDDMGHSIGTWIDFGVEMFDEGSEIGNGILSVLVDELVKELGM